MVSCSPNTECILVSGIVLSMKPCQKWSQSRTSSSTSSFCRNKDVTGTSRKCATSAATFPECLSCFLWVMPTSENYSAATPFLKQSQSFSSILRHLYTSGSIGQPPRNSDMLGSVKQQLAVPLDSRGRIYSVVSLNMFSSVHTKCLIKISDQHRRKTELFIYKKRSLFILFILKNYSVYLVLLLFVSIDILHVACICK